MQAKSAIKGAPKEEQNLIIKLVFLSMADLLWPKFIL